MALIVPAAEGPERESLEAAVTTKTSGISQSSLLTIQAASPTLLCEVEVTARIFNSECLQMARPSYGAAAPRVSRSMPGFAPHSWTNRLRGTLDSGKGGQAP